MPSGDVDLHVSDAAINAGLTAALQPWLTVLTEETAALARVECPVGKDDPLGRPRQAPHMRDMITARIVGTVGVVTAASAHALSVHEGAKPHPIVPTGSGYPLKFYWSKMSSISGRYGPAGNVARFMSVSHPGIVDPNPFLLRALQQVIGKLR